MSLKSVAGVLGAVVLAAVSVSGGQLDNTKLPSASRVSVKDPCEVASASVLKNVLSVGLGQYFPISENKDGEKVTVSEPSITDATCPKFKVNMKASARYQKTRGFPQFSASGTARFSAHLELRVSHPITIGSGQPIPAGDVRKGDACLIDINATELNINNVPNWLDNTWLRERLLEPMLVSKCFDVTNLVRGYIQQGGVLKAS